MEKALGFGEDPIFLMGSTRSGTTLLSLMLDHHSQIGFAGEFQWVFDYIPEQHQPPLDGYYAWLSTNRFYLWHQPDIDHALGYDALVQSFLAQMKGACAPDKPFVVCSVHDHYREIIARWPRARFIHLVRDGRDVCASWLRLGWHGNAWACATEWCRVVDQWEEMRRAVPASQRLELRFEDLVTDPGAALQRVCAFAGVAFEPAMLDYPRSTTYGPVDPEEAAKWRKSLTKRQVRLFEAVAGNQLLRHGYPVSGWPPVRLAPPVRFWLALDDRVEKNVMRVRTYGLPLWLGEHVGRRLRIEPLHRKVQLRMHAVTNATLK